MVGTLPPPGYVTKMANWQAQGPGQAQAGAIYSVDNQLRWAHHLDANGQNIYAVIFQWFSLCQIMSGKVSRFSLDWILAKKLFIALIGMFSLSFLLMINYTKLLIFYNINHYFD